MWFLLSHGQVGRRLGLRADAEARAIFAIFAIGFTAIALEIVLLNLRAWQLREPLRLNWREKFITHSEILGWSLPVAVGLVSLGLALTLPINQIAWSGWVYFSMAILVPIQRAWRRRCGLEAVIVRSEK